MHTAAMKNKFFSLLLGVMWAACAVGVHAEQPALQTIASLDVPRYMGTWYEIAKYPNSFQKKCVRNTRADYQTQPDGTVQVLKPLRSPTAHRELRLPKAHRG